MISTPVKNSLRCLSVGVALAMAQSAMAVSIVITTQVDNSNTDNVLFNDGSLQHQGLFVQGNFSGTGTGYTVRFTSPSGNGQILGSGGQATITGQAGNDPFTSLTFGLENNATFTAAVFNPDVTNAAGNGTINFTVNYLLGDGLGPFTDSFSVNANGQNFFRIDALPDARITSINYNTTNTTFADGSQFRLGGFAPGSSVPDGGATVALMGLALGGLSAGRRFFIRK